MFIISICGHDCGCRHLLMCVTACLYLVITLVIKMRLFSHVLSSWPRAPASVASWMRGVPPVGRISRLFDEPWRVVMSGQWELGMVWTKTGDSPLEQKRPDVNVLSCRTCLSGVSQPNHLKSELRRSAMTVSVSMLFFTSPFSLASSGCIDNL